MLLLSDLPTNASSVEAIFNTSANADEAHGGYQLEIHSLHKTDPDFMVKDL